MLALGLLTIAGVGIETGIDDWTVVLDKWPGTGRAAGTGILALAIAAGIIVGIWWCGTVRTKTDTGADLLDVLGMMSGGFFNVVSGWVDVDTTTASATMGMSGNAISGLDAEIGVLLMMTLFSFTVVFAVVVTEWGGCS